MLVDVLQFLELFFQVLEGECLLQEGALQLLILAHDLGELDFHLLAHLVGLKPHDHFEF